MNLEKDILEGCIKGNAKAQHTLYKLSFPVLIKVCYRYACCKDDAIDLLNQGFLKIVTNIRKYDATGSFEGWMKKIMVNTIIDEFRKNKNYRQTLYLAEKEVLESMEHKGYSSSNEGEDSIGAQEVMECLQRLPEVTKNVINLNAIDGYSHKEIAEMLGISENASRWHLHSARVKLKKMLEEREKKTERHFYASER